MELALTFNDFTFTPVTHQNSLWIRAAELARALGYSSENLVSRIYKRNAEEFTSDMTQVIENVAEDQSGLLRNLNAGRGRIFSLRGCHLLAMFARTPVAKAFRKWVLDVLDQLAEKEQRKTSEPAPSFTPSTVTDREPLRAIVNAWSRITGQPQNNLWPQVRAAFNITNIKQLPAEWVPDAIAWVQAKIDALPPAPEQEALPAVPSPSASFLSADDIAALEAAGQRVIALSAYVHREIHELHVEILNVLDIRRMPAGRWRAMSSHIWYSLLDAVNIAPESLTRDTVTGREDHNPAYWTLEMLKDMPAA